MRRAETRYPRTLVGRVALTSGWRVDRDVQFFADGLTGLRGYRAHTFAGSRAVVMNLEQRFYLGRAVNPEVNIQIDYGYALPVLRRGCQMTRAGSDDSRSPANPHSSSLQQPGLYSTKRQQPQESFWLYTCHQSANLIGMCRDHDMWSALWPLTCSREVAHVIHVNRID